MTVRRSGIERIKDELDRLPRSLASPPIPAPPEMNIKIVNDILRGRTAEIHMLGVKNPILLDIHQVGIDPLLFPRRKLRLLSDHGTEEQIPEDKIWNFLRGELVLLHDSTGEEYGIALKNGLSMKHVKEIMDALRPRKYH